jgi:hypothetical protein
MGERARSHATVKSRGAGYAWTRPAVGRTEPLWTELDEAGEKLEEALADRRRVTMGVDDAGSW